jgi:hypothetical protein
MSLADALALAPGPSQPSSDSADQELSATAGPENLDKSSKTRENPRSRGKCEGQDILPSILNG